MRGILHNFNMTLKSEHLCQLVVCMLLEIKHSTAIV